ncbi:hypothetical protein [Sporocytophaga myxococcoides]|uniref:hypothetical protein n=1 Tax=Sporocytophaga myxococcoides TaxID=153721 RepID=UPI000400F1BF|nr:hypothetical protein [Sporocytophaga myxococcoides]
MTLDNNILKIANRANLKIIVASDMVFIGQKLSLKDKSLWGVVIFLLGGLFLLLISFTTISDTTSRVLCSIIGTAFLILSILTIIRQANDRVKIIDGKIIFRYNLRNSTVTVDPNMKITMRNDRIRISRATAPTSSTYISITHYLIMTDKEMPILNFQMNNSDSNEALLLGNKITQLLNKQIR